LFAFDVDEILQNFAKFSASHDLMKFRLANAYTRNGRPWSRDRPTRRIREDLAARQLGRAAHFRRLGQSARRGALAHSEGGVPVSFFKRKAFMSHPPITHEIFLSDSTQSNLMFKIFDDFIAEWNIK